VSQHEQAKGPRDDYIIDNLRGDILEHANRIGIIKYKDRTEMRKLGWTTGSGKMGDVVCDVEAFAYPAPAGFCDGAAVRAHFEVCERAALSVGHTLGLSMPVNGIVQGGTMQDGMVDRWSANVAMEQQSVGTMVKRRTSFQSNCSIVKLMISV
jgi:hypothetical protein